MPDALDPAALVALVDRSWEAALPSLSAYTEIRCLSPAFDPTWQATGAITRAATLLADWVSERAIPGLSVDLVELEGRTPALLIDIPASDGDDAGNCVLVYGHLDKQPPLGEWREGLDPFHAGPRGGPSLWPRHR